MTLQIGRRQKAKDCSVSQVRVLRRLMVIITVLTEVFLVKRYVEGLPDASKTQLLDLIAASGQGDIEPTRATSGRQQLYPDVCICRLHSTNYSLSEHLILDSTSPCLHCLPVSKPASFTRDISTQINIIILRSVPPCSPLVL